MMPLKLHRLSTVPIRQILKTLPHKKYLMLLGAFSRVPDLVTPVLFGYLISMLSGGATGSRVYLVVGGIILFALLALLISWVNQRLTVWAFTDQERRLKEIVWHNIQGLPVLARDATSPGVWMQKFARDIPVVLSTCQMLLETGLGFILFFFGTFLLVIWKAPWLSALFVAVLVFAAISHVCFNKQINAETRQLRESFYDEGEVIHDLLEMLPVLSSFGVTDLFKPLFESRVVRSANRQCAQRTRMIDFQTLLLSEIWSVRAIILLTCTFLFLAQDLQVGDIVMYDMLIAQMLGGLSQVMLILPQLDIGLEYAASLKNVLSDPAACNVSQSVTHDPVTIFSSGSADETLSPQAAFDIKSVTFRYLPDTPPVISNFSACIRTGEFVCFLGRNGTGKSTLVKLLSGMYAPESGRVYSVDHHPMIVPQHIVIYRDTLLENIRLRDTTIQESCVETVLQQCGLAGFLKAYPLGIHTNLSPGSCSGGELRALGIARALVRNPKTLILDEITNNLDVVAKEAVYEVLASLRRQCTIILITHDISCTDLADRVFVFQQSGISEIIGDNAASRTREALRVIRADR